MDEQYKQYYEMINQQQQANNAWSAEQAQKAMDYQTQMSNTAHQREVADLKAAGLNPVLSAGGQGATTSSGHAAQAGNENITALYGLISKSIDAQLEQAKAMRNAAKGSGSGFGSDDDKDFLDTGFVEGLEEMLYRMFGIKPDTTDEIIEQSAAIAKALEKKLGYIPKAFMNMLSFNPDKRQSGKDFFEADKDRNGYLNQKEFAQFAYDNKRNVGSPKATGATALGSGSKSNTSSGYSGRSGTFAKPVVKKPVVKKPVVNSKYKMVRYK